MSATHPFLATVLLAAGLTAGAASRVQAPLEGPTTAQARAHAARPLPFFYDVYTFRGEDRRTAVVASYAVEAGELETEPADGGEQYRFSVTLALADLARRSVTKRHDTVFARLPHRLPDEHLLYTHLEVRAPPSRGVQERVLMTDATTAGIGQLYWHYVTIPDYSGRTLMLSDIALGLSGARTGWTRGAVTLALLPTSQLPSSAFDVYYEIYNLAASHAYTTEIAIERMPDEPGDPPDDRPPVRLRFDGQAAADTDGTVPELRHVETSLPKGRYRLTVTVTDLTARRSAHRSRTFEVRATTRAATMVPALPVERGRR